MGELYTWGHSSGNHFHLGHVVNEPQLTPKRVEALSHVEVVAAVICDSHTLVTDKDGVVWGFGPSCSIGLGDAAAPPGFFMGYGTALSDPESTRADPSISCHK